MAEQYFQAQPSAQSRERRIQVQLGETSLRFFTDNATFSKEHLDEGSRILLEALPPLGGRVADLGCGWGALGGVLAKKWADVHFVLTDVNERAAALAERNLKLNGLDNFEVVCGDGFSAVEGTFDWIVTNPPIRAGKEVIYGLFAEAKDYLVPGGTLALVIRTQQGAKSAERYLRGIYESVETLDVSGGYRVLAARNG